MLDDEVALGHDSRYKSFIVAIEKVLKQFEHSTEWADLITILVKVKKVRSHVFGMELKVDFVFPSNVSREKKGAFGSSLE